MTISKTDFLSYLDSPRHLWAIKHGKLNKQETDTFLKHLFKQGYEVEALAEKYIEQHLIPQYGVSKEDVITQPKQLDDHYLARTDILIKNKETDKWDMYEIKSSTSVDRIHRYDATFQTLVFEKHFELGDIYILHLNKEYVRDGKLNLKELFISEKVNRHIKKLREEVIQQRYEAYLIAKQEDYTKVLECIRPKTCPCIDLCHPELPQYSIYDINMITGNEKKVRELTQANILDVMDVPKDFKLSDKQRNQVNVAQSNNTIILKQEIKERLDDLIYPLYFIDYETFNPAIPMYDGYKSFDQMPFQYSLHIKRDKESELEHYEFIETNKIDPIPNFLDSLKEIIGDKGSIIVWNKAFEGKVNERMGEIHTQYSELTENMNSRLFDLMDIFRDQLYVDPLFKGSYSIKNVLPVLVPELSYKELEVGDGAEAMTKWNELVYKGGKKEIREDLLKYCELDTLAMVRIWEFLNRLG